MDSFAREGLPSAELLPEFVFDLPELQCPENLNAVDFFLDRNVRDGRGDAVAIRSGDGLSWTYDELLKRANQIARVLVEDFGVEPGERVLLRAANTPMLAACWFAVLKAGAICVTTMPLYRATELGVITDKAQVKLALCDVRLREELEAAYHGQSDVRIEFFDEIERLMTEKPTSFQNVDTRADDVALIAFTSGTTGVPKAAMHFHRDLLAICHTYAKYVLQADATDLFCGSPPLAFTFGLGGHLLFPFYVGAATLLLEKASPDELVRNIPKFGVTTLFTAPIAYRAMTTLARGNELASLKRCVSAGETLPKPVFEAFEAKTGLKILDGIGSTEMLHIFIGSPMSEVRAGSTGRVVPGYRAEIHDDDGMPMPPGEVGRLAVKGPTGCKYLQDMRQTTYVRNGWNYPGDAYTMDADGYFHYVARTDDMIVSAGYNISGPEVEQALLGHPSVKEVAVVAKPDVEHDTNIVKAYVVLAAEADSSDTMIAELQAFCKRSIAPFKAPREIEFVNELPRTETGKVQRYKLRNRASSE